VIPVATPGTRTPATTLRRTTRHSVARGNSAIPTRRAQTPASVTVPTRHHHNSRTSSRRNNDGVSSVNDAIVDAAEDISVVEPVLNPNAERYCYCDRPSNTACAHCSNGACSIHAYVQCTGPCERWFHPECAGWKVHRDALGDPTHIVPGWDNPTCMSIPLSTSTQGGTDTPFWCIKCYGALKQEPDPITNVHWRALSLEEKVLRIGLLPPEGLADTTIKKRSLHGSQHSECMLVMNLYQNY
jgi:hypothetical protein